MDLPDDLISALDTLGAAVSGLPSASELEAAYTFTYEGDSDGVTVSVRDLAVGSLKSNLQMSGSDIEIIVPSKPIVIGQGGVLLPLQAKITLMDPKMFELPISKACGKGARPCVSDDRSLGPSGAACKIFCTALESLFSKPVFEQTIDLVAQLPDAVACGDNKCYSVGDSAEACTAPPPAPSPGLNGTPTAQVGTAVMVAVVGLWTMFF